jgi:hypothetical protein
MQTEYDLWEVAQRNKDELAQIEPVDWEDREEIEEPD